MLLSKTKFAMQNMCREIEDRIRRDMQSLEGLKSNDAHDTGDDVHRECDLARKRLAHLRHVLANHQIVELATSASMVAIGTIVTFQRYDARGNAAPKPETYIIGDYGSTDPSQDIPVISHDSILVAGLLGRVVGDTIMVKLKNGSEIELELLDIRLPSAPVQFRLAA